MEARVHLLSCERKPTETFLSQRVERATKGLRMKKDRGEQGSRRDFLRSAFVVGITAATVVIPVDRTHGAPQKSLSTDNARPLAFFRPDEAEFLSAAVDRFIPPDEEWPGAVDAGVVGYLDQQMAGKWGSAGYMYWHGPFKEGT